MATGANLSARLRNAPTYQAALQGRWFAPGMPKTSGFKAQHLRAAARQDGIEIPSGWAFNGREFHDANDDNWYSDPRVLGPAAVAVTGALGAFGALPGLAGGAQGAASGAASGYTTIAPGSGAAVNMSPAATAGIGPNLSPAAWAAGAGAGTDFLGNKPSVGSRIANAAKNAVTGGGDGMNWWQQAALAALSGVPALIATAKNKPSAEEQATQEQIRQMLASQQKRYDYQSPLFQAVTQLAMGRLPTANQRPLAENL